MLSVCEFSVFMRFGILECGLTAVFSTEKIVHIIVFIIVVIIIIIVVIIIIIIIIL